MKKKIKIKIFPWCFVCKILNLWAKWRSPEKRERIQYAFVVKKKNG